MVAHIKTVAFRGIDVLEVDVQVQLSSGLPSFTLVGLPDKAVGESKERIRAAFNALGLALPSKRITVNLAPADLFKEGSHYDLPIAVGLLVALNVLPAEEISEYYILGELGLDGSISAVTGILPASIQAYAKNMGLICPLSQGSEAAWSGSKSILAAANILNLINHFKGTQILSPPEAKLTNHSEKFSDLQDIKGQNSAKRALEIAAAGGHNLVMIGPPGSGKSMLASRLPGLLPPLSSQEALEISMIHSLAGQLNTNGLVQTRPFREPHHSASLASMVGGGNKAKPGEISLAHLGVLFLDELPEFSRQTLESLRQPLETGSVTIARASHHVTYPARFQLIAAMNPCRCGYLDNSKLACTKAPKCAMDYQAKISGPFFDRLDLYCDVPAIKPDDLSSSPKSEPSEQVAMRVLKARQKQQGRFQSLQTNYIPRYNAEMTSKLVDETSKPDTEGLTMLNQACEKFHLSARSYYRILKVARTIADLCDEPAVRKNHIAEALTYRRLVYN
ncbi:MAG: YifB family Mg chelatase-like AAA ATPase [Alphaproteobacteria bacterium]|nr:YifB family Mg chelatase-like AAA ATPase [Alphaproteobacteria bacterium]